MPKSTPAKRLHSAAIHEALSKMHRDIEREIFHEGSPTGRIIDRQPEPQEFPREAMPRGGEMLQEFAHFSPGMWESLERRAAGFKKGELAIFSSMSGRAYGKSWFGKRIYEERQKVLSEQRQLGHLAIKKAIAAFLASFKR